MMERRKSKSNSIPIYVGSDPSLWRFASLQEALQANIDLVARLIRAGEARSQNNQNESSPAEPGSQSIAVDVR